MKNEKLTHGSLFSGIGGFDLAAKQCEIETLWNCELLKKSRQVLSKIDNALQYDNIKTLEKPQYVDIISGGFPCQDISLAGNGTGIFGDRSSLFFQMLRIIRQVRPKYIIIENSPMLLVRGLEYVLQPLSEIGYICEWKCLSNFQFGFPHFRERIYIIAYSNTFQQKTRTIQGYTQIESIFVEAPKRSSGLSIAERIHKIPDSDIIGINDGISNWTYRVGALGNAVNPVVAKYLFQCIKRHFLTHSHDTTKSHTDIKQTHTEVR